MAKAGLGFGSAGVGAFGEGAPEALENKKSLCSEIKHTHMCAWASGGDGLTPKTVQDSNELAHVQK